jgi:hypothetical protein
MDEANIASRSDELNLKLGTIESSKRRPRPRFMVGTRSTLVI